MRHPAPLFVLVALAFLPQCRAPQAPLAPHLGAAAERLAQDVAWLADDAREGRRAGSSGERQAAQWLAARLKNLGLEPAGSEGFLQPFDVPLPPEDGGGSFVSEEGLGKALGPARCVPATGSAGGEVKGPLVFRGYGIVDTERGRDDFGDDALEGAVVLVVRGAPDRNDWGQSDTLFHKAMNAASRGAAAVLFAPNPRERGDDLTAFRSTRVQRLPIPALLVDAGIARGLVPDYEGLARSGVPAAPTREVTVLADVDWPTGRAQNVLARLPGSGAARTAIVGAHFDHLGRGGAGSLAPKELGEIHNGADDNASGTAAVLEIARRFVSGADRSGPLPGDLVFALWSGEELGLIGSKYWVDHPTVPLDDVVGYVNLDMVGRAGSGHLQVLGVGTSPAFVDWMDDAGFAAGLQLEVSLSGQGLGGSDHQSFLTRSIPALHLFSGLHGDYHRPSDDVDGFEALGAARVVDLSIDLLRRMQAAPALAFAQPDVPSTASSGAAWSVRFGSIPDYAWDGDGMRIDGTSPDSPAEAAGLLAGDILLEVGGVEIQDVYGFMYVLQIHKPGDVVETRYLRGNKEESVPVTLTARHEGER